MVRLVLLRPRSPENLGAVARVMKNFGLDDWAVAALGTHDFAAARRGAVPVLAGATAHEFNMGWLGAGWVTADMVRDGLARAGVPAEAGAGYLERAGARPQDAVGQAQTDRTFRVPAQRLAAATADGGWPGPRKQHEALKPHH